jgi:hypothetical protein
MARGTLFADEKLLRDHYLRQERGHIAGYLAHVFKEVMGLFEFLRYMRDMPFLYSNKVLKLLGKEYYKQSPKSVRMYWKRKRCQNL